jgi:hypothetical protein
MSGFAASLGPSAAKPPLTLSAFPDGLGRLSCEQSKIKAYFRIVEQVRPRSAIRDDGGLHGVGARDGAAWQRSRNSDYVSMTGIRHGSF